MLYTAMPEVDQPGEGNDCPPAIRGVRNYTSVGILVTKLGLWVYDKVDGLNVSRKTARLPAAVSTQGTEKITLTNKCLWDTGRQKQSCVLIIPFWLYLFERKGFCCDLREA